MKISRRSLITLIVQTLAITLIAMMLLNACATEAIVPAPKPAAPSASSSVATSIPAEQYLEQGMALSEKGRYDEAIRDLTKAIELDHEDARAYYLRGIAHVGKKEYEKAVTDLTRAADLEITDEELHHLEKVIDLVVPPGQVLLLDAACFSEGGIDCQGNPKPYSNTLQMQLFVNPGESGIEVNKIHISLPIGGKTEINSPIRYFNNLGFHYLIAGISSTDPPISAPSCSIEYKPRNDASYKKSNECSSTKLSIGRLICPTQ